MGFNKYGKIKIDFQVLYDDDPFALSIYDKSYWQLLEGKPSIIEITTPGASEPVVNTFEKKSINIFNSINLGLSCPTCDDISLNELPDGIYTIVVKASPDNFNKESCYLRTTKLRLEIDKIYIKANLLDKVTSTDLIEKLNWINLLLRSAEANLRYGNLRETQQIMFEVHAIVEKIKRCPTGNCK